ncbi:MAG: hypothetical protein KDB01_17430 [Planctomycetaceae bacterium]|nr:hypothetical protein [Planctomycetaceae bacterium]
MKTPQQNPGDYTSEQRVLLTSYRNNPIERVNVKDSEFAADCSDDGHRPVNFPQNFLSLLFITFLLAAELDECRILQSARRVVFDLITLARRKTRLNSPKTFEPCFPKQEVQFKGRELLVSVELFVAGCGLQV